MFKNQIPLIIVFGLVSFAWLSLISVLLAP